MSEVEEMVNQAQEIVDQAHSATEYNRQSDPSTDPWLGFEFYHPSLEAAKRALVDWHNRGNPGGNAIVLAGGCGAGKTHLARCVKKATKHAMIYSEPDLVADLRGTYQYKASKTEALIIRECRRAYLLVLDDIGTAYVKQETLEWLQDIYWRIIDYRTEAGYPLLITTNLQFAELTERLGERASSRLLGMMGSKDNYVNLSDVPDYRLRGWQ